MEYSRDPGEEQNPFSYKNFLNRYGTSRDGLPPSSSAPIGSNGNRGGPNLPPSFLARVQQMPQQLPINQQTNGRMQMPTNRMVPPVRAMPHQDSASRRLGVNGNGGNKSHEVQDIFADSGDGDSGDDEFSGAYRQPREWLNGHHEKNDESWLHSANNGSSPPSNLNIGGVSSAGTYFPSDISAPAGFDLSRGMTDARGQDGLLPVRRNSSERSLSNRLTEVGSDGLSGVDFSNNSRLDDRMYINKLRKEVAFYKQKLEETEGYADQTSQELQRCTAELDAMRIREREETAAMEKVMQHVEANLQSTTRRALEAETTLSAVLEENRALKQHIAELTAENESLHAMHGNDFRHLPAYERAHSLAKFLQAGCQSANFMLKDMLDGVEQIRLAALSLESLGTIEEASSSSPQTDRRQQPLDQQQLSNKSEL